MTKVLHGSPNRVRVRIPSEGKVRRLVGVIISKLGRTLKIIRLPLPLIEILTLFSRQGSRYDLARLDWPTLKRKKAKLSSP
jgi:hypothetical protein